MKKSTDLFCKINAINTYNCIIISYSTILYHMIVESQLVINVVSIWIKMLYKIFLNTYKYYISVNRYFNSFYIIDTYI